MMREALQGLGALSCVLMGMGGIGVLVGNLKFKAKKHEKAIRQKAEDDLLFKLQEMIREKRRFDFMDKDDE